jgi:flagella basal body P-ring formation protein FlgA
MKPIAKNFSFIVIASILFLQVSYSNSAANSNSVIIKMHNEVHITSEKIRLGDIAEIQSDNWGQTKKLGDLIIGTAPIPGRYRYIKRNDIVIQLKKNRIDLSKIQFESSEKVKIFRNFIRISKKEIEDILLSEINKGKIWDIEKVKVKKIQVAHAVVLPQGILSYQVVPPLKNEGLGPIPIQIFIRIDGKYKKKVTAIVYTEVLADVVVVKKPLRRFQTITSNDIVLRKMDLTTLSSNTILQYREVIGKRTTRVINPNTVLRTDLIEFPPIIRRRDIVRIISESDRLRITTLGEAQEKGAKGQRIKVINTKSGEKIYARVVDARTVQVEF